LSRRRNPSFVAAGVDGFRCAQPILRTQVHVFGSVAVAIAAAEMTENGAHVNRNVEMLLVKSDGAWRIVCQAWDRAGGKPIPDDLV
jgi:hypothetical protein